MSGPCIVPSSSAELFKRSRDRNGGTAGAGSSQAVRTAGQPGHVMPQAAWLVNLQAPLVLMTMFLRVCSRDLLRPVQNCLLQQFNSAGTVCTSQTIYITEHTC